MDFILCAVSNLFRIYLIYQFAEIFFGKSKEERLKKLLIGIFFYIINMILYWEFHIAWVNGVCNLVGIGLIMWSYTKLQKMIFFLTGAIFMVNIGCDLLVTRLFTNYQDGIEFDQIYTVLVVFMILICELLTEKLVNARYKRENFQSVFLILVPMCSIGLLFLLDYINCITNLGLAIMSAGLLLLNFFVFYLYNILSEMFTQKYENEVLCQKIENYASQLNNMVDSEERVKALRHDMKHHLNELKLMASKKECKAIEKYIEDMESFVTNPYEVVSSGNIEIDSVLNCMLQQAKNRLDTVNVKLRIPESMSYSFDVNVILGNLLENAIEAASQTTEKQLYVDIRFKQGILKIDIENSFNGQLRKGRNGLLTTKKEKYSHGIGIGNVKKIVEKYDGSMEICPHDRIFVVKLILYMPDMEN